jgi:uncharacterized membrane protein YcaP (DUF421 family)
MEGLIGVAVRATVMYWYALLIMRLAGKRSIGNLTPIDFVVALIIGDMFDDVIWAEIPIAKGLVGMTTIVLLHSLMAYATYRSTRLHDLLNSTPTRVILNGRMLPDGLARERTPSGEVDMELRLQQEDHVSEIEQGCWEPSGEVSLQKFEPARPAQKRDRTALRKLT